MVTMVVQNLKPFSNTFLICKILCDRHHGYYQASVVSLTCTFSNPIQQIKKWQKKLYLVLVVDSILRIV